ncbi:MAG: hypothetical protein MK085_03570 [Phycisphaerales bacterium]|nr:hypothetical protein [Phycisphaerales bacterium]
MTEPSPESAAPRTRSPIMAVLDLFSSVKFGIVLLVLLFIYMTIGSAGLLYPVHPNIFDANAWVHEQIRQRPFFEMTEFEWFHWWPFDALLLLICMVMVTTTIRKIPFKTVNLGVWMIHSGIIILCIGSVIYFWSKVEGDTPVIRRALTAKLVTTSEDGSVEVLDSVRFVAMPGNRATLGRGEERYDFQISSIDPNWEMLSGEDKGMRAFSVNVMVTAPEDRFIRQLIAGRPEYTEDLIFTEDPTQPFQRSVKVTGERLTNTDVVIELDYESARWLYLRNDLSKSWALYLREFGSEDWVERPIDGRFLYNDYIADPDWVWNPGTGSARLTARPMDIAIPAVSEDDPAADVIFQATGFLRYAHMRSQAGVGGRGTAINPVVWLEASVPASDLSESFTLMAFDPDRASADNGNLLFRWIEEEAAFEQFLVQPTLTVAIPELGISVEHPLDNASLAQMGDDLVEIEGTGYGFRIRGLENNLSIGEQVLSVAIVDLKTPKGQYSRWVFDEPALTRDVIDGAPIVDAGHTGTLLADPSIQVTYTPGSEGAVLVVVGGPEENQLRMISPEVGGGKKVTDMTVGQPIELPGGLQLEATRYSSRAVIETKPLVVPMAERVRDAKEFFSRLRVRADGMDGGAKWLRFHMYPFDNEREVLRRHLYRPTVVALEDGRMIELLFSRRRMPLPAEIALEEFAVDAYFGEYQDDRVSANIRDYRSMLRFRDTAEASWSAATPVSMNKPVEYGGYWYFQAQWDPPAAAQGPNDQASLGLNYTVLGVGNRHGVYIQLAGCIVAVIGMIYAFYIKPIIKQRARRRIYETARGSGAATSENTA